MPECSHKWSSWDSRYVPQGRDKKGRPVMMVRRYCKHCDAEQTRKAKDVMLTFVQR